MKKLIFVLLIVFAACFACRVFAQNDIADSITEYDSGNSELGVIEGIVYHFEGSLLEGANVVLDDYAKHTKSGPDGSYRIEGVPPGPHHVMCWREGYFDLGKDVNVEEGETVTLDFPLLPRV